MVVAAATVVFGATVVAEPAVVAAQDAGRFPVRSRTGHSSCLPLAGGYSREVQVKRITIISRRHGKTGTVYRLVSQMIVVGQLVPDYRSDWGSPCRKGRNDSSLTDE
ncbi:hypothetical protein ACGFMK_36080 [Amycolatopsis sp. NPDC049252]|uniref:hypothetical protein n=1 Tax=Amycolatopsis sp. NPDC049252 TaxID=3363933 RepID=UPI00371B79F0